MKTCSMQLSHQATGHWKDETVKDLGETRKWLSNVLDKCTHKKYYVSSMVKAQIRMEESLHFRNIQKIIDGKV